MCGWADTVSVIPKSRKWDLYFLEVPEYYTWAWMHACMRADRQAPQVRTRVIGVNKMLKMRAECRGTPLAFTYPAHDKY